MHNFSIIKRHTALGIYKWEDMKHSFAATVFFLHFSLQPHFLKAVFDKFSGRGVLLGKIQVHKTLSLLILQVQFNFDSSVLLVKLALPHI